MINSFMILRASNSSAPEEEVEALRVENGARLCTKLFFEITKRLCFPAKHSVI